MLAANEAIPSGDLCPVGPRLWTAGSPVSPLRPLPPGMPQARPTSSLESLFGHLQGIKKPYNPILGETFRCCWFHPQTNSHTFYLAEQARQHSGLRLVSGWSPAEVPCGAGPAGAEPSGGRGA